MKIIDLCKSSLLLYCDITQLY